MSGRRQFIKRFALSTAVSFFGGKLWTARLLADMGSSAGAIGRIAIKLSDYPALQSQYGSVRFSFADPSGGIYPFVLTRTDTNVFYAVDTKCSHAGCVVEAFDSGPFAMICNCHGSEYNFQGQVTNGPATVDLLQYAVEFDEIDTVTVLVPGLDMTISNVTVQEKTASTIRLRLQFPTVPLGRYRVHFQQDLNAPPNEIPFSISPTGAPTVNEITGNGNIQTVYAQAALPQGFFSVALVVEPY